MLIVARTAASLLSLSAASSRTRHLTMASSKMFNLDEFVLRQFDDPNYSGTKIAYDKAEFEAKINAMHASGEYPLVDGYAPFCKHLFVPNFVGDSITVPYLEITPENEHHLRSGYEARTEQELPVMVRWFPAATAPPPPVAEFLDVILYSRDQIQKETEAMGKSDDGESCPWGIISLKAQSVDFELPMQPITMMRNALGKEEGGSGVGLDRAKYKESVDFWTKHASIK